MIEVLDLVHDRLVGGHVEQKLAHGLLTNAAIDHHLDDLVMVGRYYTGNLAVRGSGPLAGLEDDLVLRLKTFDWSNVPGV